MICADGYYKLSPMVYLYMAVLMAICIKFYGQKSQEPTMIQ